MVLIDKKSPTISVIVVSWNVRAELEHCLNSLMQTQDVPYEVIVVDNDSKDGTAVFLDQLQDVRVIRNRRNRGFAYAVNQGVLASRGEYILLVNPDVEVFTDTVARFAAILARDERIGVLGGKMINEDGSIQHSVHRYPHFLDQALTLLKLRGLLTHSAIFSRYLAADFTYKDFSQVDQVAGALFAFPRRVFDRVGGFDARYFLWFEEVDFCRRVAERKFQVCFTPEVGAKHLGGRSAAQLTPLRRHLLFQSSMLHYFSKFHPPLHIFLLPFAVLGTILAALLTIFPQSLIRRLFRPSYVS